MLWSRVSLSTSHVPLFNRIPRIAHHTSMLCWMGPMYDYCVTPHLDVSIECALPVRILGRLAGKCREMWCRWATFTGSVQFHGSGDKCEQKVILCNMIATRVKCWKDRFQRNAFLWLTWNLQVRLMLTWFLCDEFKILKKWVVIEQWFSAEGEWD